jgi:RNA polymerase sigma factor (sigma-70 family)
VIFRRHRQELYRYCRAILTDPDDAQDALQSTMLAAMRALPGERRSVAIRPWLFRVAHNEAVTIARSRRGHAAPEEDHLAVPGADLAAEDRERLRLLVADLDSLPERQRGALVMRELSGLSYSDIAATFSTSAGAARQLVHEAREAMRESRLGRDADCREIRKLISTRDGRILRGRKVRAHLRTCKACEDYLAAISRRRADLQLLAPPLPALAATGIVAGLIGTAGGAGGGSVAAKGGALVAAAIVGAGAAGVTTGAIDLPGGLGPSAEAERAPAAQPADVVAERPLPDAQPLAGDRGRADSSAESPARPRGDGRGDRPGADDQGRGPRGEGGQGAGAEGSRGQGVPAGGSDGVTGPPAHASGNGPPPTAGTGAGNAGGSSASSSGVSATPPRSESGAAHTNSGAGGPPEHANGSGNPHR